jgi:DNA-binding NarL/FixJ family response regulator
MMITIVLADDHAVMRDGLRVLLEMQPDLRVSGEASTGRQAIHQAQQARPDVLIMDIGMAELNGIDATHQVRALCPDTQVVILSMHSTEEHIARALQAGALGYVLKESAGIEVIDAVRAAKAGQRYLSPKIAAICLNQHREIPDPLQRLSTREREILQLMVEGRTSAQMGSILRLSPKTVETYRSRLMQKLGFSNLPNLVKFAIQQGIISLE